MWSVYADHIFTLTITYLTTLAKNGKGPSIKYVRKISRKTNITNPLIVSIRGLEMLVFWKILRTYLMDDP